MNAKPNPKLAAIKVGDLLKCSITVNEINRVASGTFPFSREDFPSEGITSKRAQLIFDWLMTLFKQKISDAEKLEYLRAFVDGITPDKMRDEVYKILRECGIPYARPSNEEDFDKRGFHPEVMKHSRSLFLEGNYFHAVFESAKAFNVAVKQRAGVDKDGQALMHEAFSSSKPLIKITPCKTTTERDIQDGYRFLAAGLMSAIRNPIAHEPAISFPVGRDDALDILSLISYLFRWLDEATVERENK